jgi:hypothetical protein
VSQRRSEKDKRVGAGGRRRREQGNDGDVAASMWGHAITLFLR